MSLYTGPAEDPILWPEHLALPALPRTTKAAEATVFLYPWFWQHFGAWINPTQVDAANPQLLRQLQERLDSLVTLAQKHRKPLLLFDYSDAGPPSPCPQAWIWRTSLDARTRQPQEWALPAFHADAGFQPLAWDPLPSVGFCGQAFSLHPGIRKRLGEAARRWLGRPVPGPWGYRLRRDAMRSCLAAGARLRCGFQLTDPCDPLPPDQQRQRFLANLHGHAYSLCGSGYGNYSYRFYEALSAGSIPVLLNSHCVLPFHDSIPWRDLVVWVEPEQIPYTAAVIEAFHRRFTAESFAAHQRRLRQIWESSCSRSGFQQQLSHWLQSRLP